MAEEVLSSSPETLSEYSDYAETVIDRYPQMDEANTKQKLLSTFIEVLGWNPAFDVELEYSVPMGSGTKKVDFALMIDGTPMVFIEAKGCDSTLTGTERDQLKSYMKQQNVDWGLLSNGREYQVMHRHIDNGNVLVDVLGSATVAELMENEGLITALSKEAIDSGQSIRFIQRLNDLRRAESYLREHKDELADKITTVVTDEAGDAISQYVETESKEFIDAVIENIETDALEADILKESDTGGDFWDRTQKATGITLREGQVVLPDDKSAAESLADFARFLFVQGYLNETDLPIKSGRKRYLLNNEPVDQKGDQMRRPKEVVDDVYLESNYSTAKIKSHIIKMTDLVEE